MADFKYIMQGFQKDINFFDEIKEVLETEDYTSIWILTAFVNERAICNLMPSIKKSKADISFIIGIRNNVSTYQALKCLINMKVSVFVFDTARIESIFHAKVIVGSGTNSAKVICGSANITTGGLANNIEAGIISKLNLRCESDEKFLTEVREYIDNIIHNYPQNVKKISEDRELDELYEQGLVVDENQRKLRNNFFCASKEKQEKSIVSRFPLVNKKLLNFGKKQKQTNAILRKLDQVIVEEVCEEVWKSNKLTKSHLGIVKKGTHAKGEMSLGKGQYRQIDQFTYFRDTVFRDLDWKNNKPIIIDQPEDNLDNQSVYNKLVPCICAAKQKRQVIIVTHNPNIAVACDAEQIICCKMDKNTHKITYLSGAIEDQEIKQNVVDILEGTMPAFDLRRRKYV